MSDNIKVVVKVRPLISREIEGKASCQWRSVKDNSLYQLDENGKDLGPCYTFDKVYGVNTKTSDVYQDVAKPIVEAATAGFNGTIFAYGQTSSGKTYTMSGTEDSPGIIPLAVYNLFEIIKNIPDREFLVRVSYIEIYNEALKDLLNINEKKAVKVHETLQGVKVDATEHVTASPEEVLKYLKEGESNRQTGATNMNEISSRSHSIFQITIESREHIEGEAEAAGCVNVSQLNLVDLAGSERAGQTGATGIRFKEGTHINKSLSALALVIKQLSEDPNKYMTAVACGSARVNKFTNYRDSKLTRILQNSLGGNAKTCIICAITPAAIEETISTLQFANRAKAIKNKPEVNAVATDATMIQSLTKQLSKLQSQLEDKRNLEVMLESKKNVEVNLKNKIVTLQKLILNGFGQRSSAEIVGNRRKNAQLRRVTISTLHSIEEDPVPPTIPKFCTPSLKYNSMLLPGASDFAPIQDSSKLSSVSEELHLVTPPPIEKRVNFQDEVIDLDSDDDSMDVTCSPYHSCYVSSKTPPCVLRRKAKVAEKDLKDIIELTDREKIYTPEVVELMKKLEHNSSVIAKLEEEVNSLNTISQEKDVEIGELRVKVSKSEEEMKTVAAAKLDMETICKEYNTKLNDWEVTYERLEQKTKRREEELLSLLEEHQKAPKRTEHIGGKALSRTIDRELSHFMDMSKDISLVNSDNECSITNANDDDNSSQIQDLVAEMQTQLTMKTQTILELESNLFARNLKIESLEVSCKELQIMLDSFQEKLTQSANENSLLKSTIDTLNITVKNQKSHLETARADIDSYDSLVKELQIKLQQRGSIADVDINESILEKMIESEERFIANNENIKNIIHSFKMAIHSRNKEIDTLRLNQSEESETIIHTLKQDLDSKEKHINTLCEEAQKLKDQILENIAIIDRLKIEKNALVDSENQLTEKLQELEDIKDMLDQKSNEITSLLGKLQATNNQLSQVISEQSKKEQELMNINDNLNAQKDELEATVGKLESHINEKDILIESLKNEDNQLQENMSHAKGAISKIQSILSSLSGNIYDVPKIIDNFVVIFNTLDSNLHELEIKVADVVNQKNKEVDVSNQLRSELSNLKDEYYQEKKSLLKQIQLLNSQENDYILKTDNLQKRLTEISQEFDKSRTELQILDTQCNDLKNKLQESLNEKNNLQENDHLKDEIIESLQTKIDSFNADVSKIRQECEDKNKEQIENIIHNKNSVILDLENTLQKHESAIEQKTAEAAKYTQAMQIILRKTWDLIKSFDVETNHPDLKVGESNIHTEILSALDTVSGHLTTKTAVEHNVNQIAEAKQEIEMWTQQNISLKENISVLEGKNQALLAEIEVIRTNYNNLQLDLIQGNQLIESLQNDLKNKLVEIEDNKSKVLEFKENVELLDKSTKQKIETLKLENEGLKLKCQSLETISYRQSNIDNSDYEDGDSNDSNATRKSLNNVVGTNESKPPSLVSICCKRIEECIQPSDKPVSSSNSDEIITSLDQAIPNISCQCERLLSELKLAKQYNVDFANTIEQLLKDQEEVRKEVQLLLEPSNDLQKKIINHRTNLSTLTATTYAENKSLKSQVTALKHHHTRFHMLCQRDIPAVKKQLSELMVILKKDSSLLDKANISFKRFSLPDTLENNTTISSFKNDETTLDGDLLMLDTNITLTTSADNTLIGNDNTCLDISQAFMFNEIASQTVDATETSESIAINPQIEILCSDNLKMNEKLEYLREENIRLREQVDKYTKLKQSSLDIKSSPNKTNVLIDIPNSYCQKCTTYEHESREYKEEYKKINKKLRSIDQELTELKTEKETIENKYKNLMLEVPSTDALVRKLNILEKEKELEIEKLMQTINGKNVEIKRLQEENDTLSTQVMENIDEADDLNRKLQTLTDSKTELTTKCTELQNIIEENFRMIQNGPCANCKVGNDLKCSDDITQTHSKLNRSLSESDTSSRFNKICSLQNQLHASKLDCKELTEDVTTIKKHLERSNLSLEQNMDLDDSMGESNVFTFSRAFDDPSNKFTLPNISEEFVNDIYIIDKKDCINYYLEITGTDKENVSGDLKIIDIMKMFYNNFVTRHNNEVENLVNKLKCYEESRKELEFHVDDLKTEYSRISQELNEKDNNFKSVFAALSEIKDNMGTVKENIEYFTQNGNNTDAVIIFKEKLLKFIDSGLGLSSTNIFEQLIDNIVRKHENDLSEIMNRYVKLEEHMENVTSELDIVNNNLTQMQCQLTDKETEYNLLKAQKEKVHEISNAVTLDIVKKERELSETIRKGCEKLVENDVINVEDIDWSMPPDRNINVLFDRFINQYKLKNCDSENLLCEINKSTTLLQSKDKELETLKVQNEELNRINGNMELDLQENSKCLEAQKKMYEELNKIYDSKVQENQVNINLAETYSEEINILKEELHRRQEIINNLTREINQQKENNVEEKKGKIIELMNTISSLEKEVSGLKSANEMISREKEVTAIELLKCEGIIKVNKSELEKMTSDILILRESVKENVSVIDSLKVEAKSLLEQNIQLKQQFEEKSRDCSRLEFIIKTHEKTAEIQSKMIMRLQNQKEECDRAIKERDSKLEELTAKCTSSQKDDEVEGLKKAKQSLESRVAVLESEIEALKRHTANESIQESSRRRRRSLYDSQRAFAENKQDSGDHSKIEAIFESRGKPDDLFMDVDDDSSNRSTPLRLSRGRDSLLSRTDQTDEEPGRPSSVQATRRRRQSTHDLHRAALAHTPSPRADVTTEDHTEVASLRNRLAACQEELESLQERYKELDDECETCAQYLRERDEQCQRLKKEKTALETAVSELKEKIKCMNPNRSVLESKKTFVDAVVNTDEDWANLHSVVVDRMSYDAEVEKNKRLTKTIEDLRFKKQDLKNTMAKMQKLLEKNSGKDNRELEETKSELEACRQELEELRERYKELDEECETCSQYLQERDEQCRKLKEAKAALEARLEQAEPTTRRRRQSAHDQHRAAPHDAATDTTDDFLSYQVERDDSRQADQTQRELKRLKMTVEKLAQQKAAVEHQLMTVSATHPMYVATGSAIIQNQQLTDVMKENQKLKKINAKLVNICKKRGKDNRENEDSEQRS